MNNWQSSGKPQQKSKKTPRKHQQWLAAHKVLVANLRKGINCESSDSEAFFNSQLTSKHSLVKGSMELPQ